MNWILEYTHVEPSIPAAAGLVLTCHHGVLLLGTMDFNERMWAHATLRHLQQNMLL